MPASVATATVTLTVAVNVNGTWNDTATIAQIRDQASEQAVGALRRALHDGKIAAIIKGDPKVEVVTVGVDK